MTLTNIEIVSVPVTDQDRAKAFYVDAVGFELLRDNPMGDEQRWVQLGPPGSPISITLVTWFEKMPAGTVQGLVLASDDIHGDYAALDARGVSFDGPIQDQPWGSFATFSDPDGNGWVLQGAPDAAGG